MGARHTIVVDDVNQTCETSAPLANAEEQAFRWFQGIRPGAARRILSLVVVCHQDLKAGGTCIWTLIGRVKLGDCDTRLDWACIHLVATGPDLLGTRL